jgi:DNA-directed RNA polymerase beta subunit
MERDALLSHGAAAVIQERLLHVSDKYKPWVCTQCNDFALPPPPKPKHSARLLGKELKPYCPKCHTGDYSHQITMPYAFKILMQDLEAFHIKMLMSLTKNA